MLQLNWKTFSIISIVLLLIGILLGKLLSKPKIEYKEKIVYKERVKVDTITKTVKTPDGTVTTVTKETLVKNSNLNKEIESKSAKKDWIVSLTRSGLKDETYGAQVSRRIIWDLYLGASVNTKSEIGLLLTYTF